MQTIGLQPDGARPPVGCSSPHLLHDDINWPRGHRGVGFADVMLDPSRDVGRLSNSEADELAARIARCQCGSHSPVELIVQRQLVPCAVDSGDHRGDVQLVESRTGELDGDRILGDRGSERVGLGVVDQLGENLRIRTEARSPTMQVLQCRRIQTEQRRGLHGGRRLSNGDPST